MRTIRFEFRGASRLALAAALAIGSALAAPHAGVVASARAQLTASGLTNQGIADRVLDGLEADPGVRASAITVNVHDGIATLNGHVDSFAARTRAGRLAASVKGVRVVENVLAVRPGVARSQSEIRQAVIAALAADAATRDKDIAVVMGGPGVVVLTGTVGSWNQRSLIGQVAGEVAGVQALRNQIAVATPAGRSDAAIARDIRQKLRYDALVDADEVEVAVRDGIVVLTGMVDTAIEGSRAMADAYVAGVRMVDASGLRVRDWATRPAVREAPPGELDNAALATALQAVLMADPRVEATSVTAEVDDGTVILRGLVDNIAARRSAEASARSVIGIDRVVHRIRVSGQGLLDPRRLEREASQAIARDPYLERVDVDVEVSPLGIAVLRGQVDSSFERRRAAAIIARVVGIRAVENNLNVLRPQLAQSYNPYLFDQDPLETEWYDKDNTLFTAQSDAVIEDTIEERLFWSPFVDHEEVTVEVTGSKAILTGTVDSWAEMNAAVDNAWKGGALVVSNQLVIGDLDEID